MKLKPRIKSMIESIGTRSRNAFAAFFLCLLFVPAPAFAAGNDALIKPKVIFFDVNETLLDLESMRASVGEALNGRQDLLPLWFSTMLHYSLVDNATGRYHDFGEIGVAALMMVAQNNNIALTPEEAKAAIVSPMLTLPPHPDVKQGLAALKAQGYVLVSFTNSSNKAVQKQFENAGLTDFFDRRLSIEDIRLYKPAAESYRWAAKQMGINPEEALLVAAHGWDIAGAKAAGMQAVFVKRPGNTPYPLAIPADYSVDNIQQLAEHLATP